MAQSGRADMKSSTKALVLFGTGVISFIVIPGVSQQSIGLTEAVESPMGTFSGVTVEVDFQVNGAGSNIDTIAFWEAPNPIDSLMFVTSKKSNLKLVEVWKYPFGSPSDELTPLTHSCLDQGTNGVEVDQEANLLYVSVTYSSNVCVFSLPGLAHFDTFGSGTPYTTEPNLALLKLPDGAKRLYVSDEDIVYVHDAESGSKLTEFTPLQASNAVEDMVGDDFHQIVLIPDEHGGTGIYPHDPDGSAVTKNGQSHFGDGGIFDADAEGIIIYTCPSDGASDNGEGWIVVSDQITTSRKGNDYEVFDRKTWEYLGNFKLKDASGNYIFNTDGLGSTQQASGAYPAGLFAAVNNDRSVVGVEWDKILAATGLSCETPEPTPTSTLRSRATSTSPATLPPTPTASPTLIPSATQTQTRTPLPTVTASVTPLPTATPTPVPSIRPTRTSTPEPTATHSATPLPSATAIPTAVASATSTPTNSAMPSDLNLDGQVDITDVQLCVNVFMGTETSPEITFRADVNSDGAVNILDVQLIVNTVLGA